MRATGLTPVGLPLLFGLLGHLAVMTDDVLEVRLVLVVIQEHLEGQVGRDVRLSCGVHNLILTRAEGCIWITDVLERQGAFGDELHETTIVIIFLDRLQISEQLLDPNMHLLCL